MKPETYLATKEGEIYWVCPEHIPSLYYSLKIHNCAISSCRGTRPDISKLVPVILRVKPVNENECNFIHCNEEKQSKKKYCSDKCRIAQARYNYAQKNKLRKEFLRNN